MENSSISQQASLISDLIKKENELQILQNDYDKQLHIFNDSMTSITAPEEFIKQNALLEDKFEPLNNKRVEIKDYLKNNNVGDDVVDSYFNKDASVFSGFKGNSQSRIESLNLLLNEPKKNKSDSDNMKSMLEEYNVLKQQSLDDPKNESIKNQMKNIQKNWEQSADKLKTVLKSRGRYKSDDYMESENFDEQISDLKQSIKNKETEIQSNKNLMSEEILDDKIDKTISDMADDSKKMEDLKQKVDEQLDDDDDDDLTVQDLNEDGEIVEEPIDGMVDEQSGENVESKHETLEENEHPQDYEKQIHEDVDNEDNHIYQGKENTPKLDIFKNILHSASELGFQYLETQIPEIKLIKQFVPFDMADVMQQAVSVLENNSINEIGDLKAPNGRIKLRPLNKKNEHSVAHNAVLYPFLVISLNFYMSKNEMELIRFNWVMETAIKFLLDNYLKLDGNKTEYLLSVYDSYPKELNEAFINNSKSINTVSIEQREAINNYMIFSMVQYDKIFFPSTYLKDVRKYENQSTSLISLFKSLTNPKTLFEINKIYEGIDEFILNAINNKDLLLGLMGLVYNVARESNLLDGDAVLGHGLIDGIVYYNKINSIKMISIDNDLNIMKNMSISKDNRRLDGYEISFNSEKVSQYDDKKGNSYVVFRGTDLKEKDAFNKDFMKNILNLSGSSELFNNIEYNHRYLIGTKLVQNKLKNIRNTGKGSLKIMGYSFGSIFALNLSYLYPSVSTVIYNPVISNSDYSKKFMNKLAGRNPNLIFNAIEEDPISINLKQYNNKFKIKYRKKSKYFNAHDLNNYNKY